MFVPKQMSNIIAYIEENPQESKRLIGLEYEQLQQLIQAAQLLHENQRAEVEENKVRIIKRGSGRKAKLSINEQIILTLVYSGYQSTEVKTDSLECLLSMSFYVPHAIKKCYIRKTKYLFSCTKS